MSTTPNRMQTYWTQTKEFIRQEWPKISPAALNRINGDFDLFLKYLRDTYNNFPQEEALARSKVQNFLNALEDKIMKTG